MPTFFGFNETPVHRKYELDEKIERLKQRQADKQSEVQYLEDSLPELTARIGVLRQQVDEIETALDAFSFDTQERRIVREVVDTIEKQIADSNERLYNIRYDIRQIDTALNHKDRFDLGKVDEIFREAELQFPEQLKRGYQDLLAFNKKITNERSAALRARRKELCAEETTLHAHKQELDESREIHLRLVRSTDTFDKFKEHQKELSSQRAQLVYLDEQRKKLELVVEIAREVREAERDRGRVVDEMKALIARPTPIFERFSAIFNGYCQRVLNHDGIFYFRVNASGNFDYHIGLSLPQQTSDTSSLSEGTSYKKLICALFDLALLKVYEDAPFFHFVYHDGIFEALDNRKKLDLISIIREQVATRKTQYILTLIDSDLPRDENDNRVRFSDDEIVLRLDDSGDSGRLFKFAEF